MAHNKNTIIPKYKIVPVSDWGLLSELEEITYIPAWSLHRLWELGNLKHIILDSKDEMPQIYEFVIDDIEKQIKEGYFNKEYLV